MSRGANVEVQCLLPREGQRAAHLLDRYQLFWRYVYDYFATSGVTNAVFAMDFSANAAWPEWHPLFAAMWPGNE